MASAAVHASPGAAAAHSPHAAADAALAADHHELGLDGLHENDLVRAAAGCVPGVMWVGLAGGGGQDG